MTTRVLLANPHEIFRDGLRTLINKQSGMSVVAEAEDSQKALELAQTFRPNVIIIDADMSDMSCAKATRSILSLIPGAKVIAMSMHRDNHHLSEILEAGASGYLLKDCSSEELTTAVQTVVQNHTYLSPTIANLVVNIFVHKLTNPHQDNPSVLTAREREVLKFLAEGKTAKQTASNLQLSVKTIETHRRNISHKLNIRTIAELTKYAIREGLISAEA
jgi:DNA-binding NarL/FixJ family response regulator